MKGFLDRAGDIIGKARLIRLFLNFSPMYRNTGGRLVEMSDDFHYVKIKLPLNRGTRNYVGTLYGGHMYGSVDGIFMVQLINILGEDYVIWDKSATIRFRRPGDRTLFAEFDLTSGYIDSIRAEVAALGEKDYTLHVDLCDEEGRVYAEVDKVIYIAGKEFYKEKKARKTRAS